MRERKVNSMLNGLADAYGDEIDRATGETATYAPQADDGGGFVYYNANPSGAEASWYDMDAMIRRGQAEAGMRPEDLHRTVTTAEILAPVAQLVSALPSPTSLNAGDVGKILKLGAEYYAVRQMQTPQGRTYYAPQRVPTSQPISPLVLGMIAVGAFLMLRK